MSTSNSSNNYHQKISSFSDLESINIKDLFQEWLINNNPKTISSAALITCIDRISDYSQSTKIIVGSLWDMRSHHVFQTIYNEILNAKLLRIREKKLYNNFIFAGKFYLKFLKEKPWRNRNITTAVSCNALQCSNDEKISGKIKTVLSSRFSNGYRLNSLIELKRFRAFVTEDLEEQLILTDDELKDYIAACGVMYDGKVYTVSVQTKLDIKALVENYFATGAQAIFFSEFYSKHENWLFASSVISEEMLIGLLQGLFPTLCFTQTYFGLVNTTVFSILEQELLRVWGNDILLTYTALAERVEYIPFDRIKFALGKNNNFIWNSVETFSHIKYIEILDEDCNAVQETAVKECNLHGYVSIADLPLDEIIARNDLLSTAAIHTAVYQICLSDKFDKKGKIVTRKGDVFDAFTITKEYCRSVDQCSLEDLLNFEKELTGEVHRWVPMEAGNTVLVRLNKETYVADRYVHFDLSATDNAIKLFMKGEYLPLKSFTTFGAFPDCGQEWNLFLLESYCRRFSQEFRFDTPSVNSRNAGAVIRKSCNMDYTEIMADAVANSKVELKDTSIGKFLYDSGYIGKSTTAKATEIRDKAKAIREGRG